MRLLKTFPLFFVTAAAYAQAGSSAMSTPRCMQTQVSVSFDNANGRFTGKTETGGLLVIRNFSGKPCTVLPKPEFRFEDSAGKPLGLTWEAPKFMHPGPVMIPVVIPPGAEVTGMMRWAYGSGDRSVKCMRTVVMEVVLEGGGARVPFSQEFCGSTFTLENLHVDPTL